MSGGSSANYSPCAVVACFSSDALESTVKCSSSDALDSSGSDKCSSSEAQEGEILGTLTCSQSDTLTCSSSDAVRSASGDVADSSVAADTSTSSASDTLTSSSGDTLTSSSSDALTSLSDDTDNATLDDELNTSSSSVDLNRDTKIGSCPSPDQMHNNNVGVPKHSPITASASPPIADSVTGASSSAVSPPNVFVISSDAAEDISQYEIADEGGFKLPAIIISML